MERREFIKFRRESPISNLDDFRLDPNQNDDELSIENLPVTLNNQMETLPPTYSINQTNSSNLARKISNFDSDSDDEYKNLMDNSQNPLSTASTNTYLNSRFNSSSQFSALESSTQKPKGKKKSSLGMMSDLNWSKRSGNFEVLRNQQILYKLMQKHASNSLQVNHKNMR